MSASSAGRFAMLSQRVYHARRDPEAVCASGAILHEFALYQSEDTPSHIEGDDLFRFSSGQPTALPGYGTNKWSLPGHETTEQ